MYALQSKEEFFILQCHCANNTNLRFCHTCILLMYLSFYTYNIIIDLFQLSSLYCYVKDILTKNMEVWVLL